MKGPAELKSSWEIFFMGICRPKVVWRKGRNHVRDSALKKEKQMMRILGSIAFSFPC
jgi:hypothetical protein